ncbi:UDP-2,4-diacetamido-2,4,6-trideoxy-beta-L-altropyranose hydrolase [Pontibacter ruber]|uniref:UDP-2,4-diacetamido-2,4, 6-trideoxy-beta-L-altropyranose hydrolase n=1 Tax=Pontibacter ruber TaxID=1343895 RepID=A0ABW5D000_9BACT|nr:UDP-2,4-diacetamido-2,4,6-trideoxy-beta-L-altropyranose hydrolase [Pontibacter ruber]
MDKKRRIIFRADGNSRIGLGHVVRSLALADMLRHDFECVFAIQSPDRALQEQIRHVCDGIIALPPSSPSEDRFGYELAAYISEEEIVVLDGYNFGTAYQQNIKSRGATLVCIDDIHSYTFVADAVINQAGGMAPEMYTSAPYTKLCLGPAYALLRKPFLEAARTERTFPVGKLRVLLNMGGADPDNHTLRITQELTQLEAIQHIEIIVGSAYPHKMALKNWLEQNTNATLHQNLSAREMRDLMRRCALAVTSASGVAYEYCAVGGALYVLQTADNQESMYGFLTGNNLATEYKLLLQQLEQGLRKEQFQQQVTTQREHFDGQSDERLKQLFHNLSLSANLTLRDAAPDDLELLFSWANDREVRSRSFKSEPIPLENHTRWFHARLDNPDTKLYIAEIEGEPAAHIRFEISGKVATISYLIGENYRGKGLGHSMLLKGVERLKKQRPDVQQVEGLVQQDNTASVRAFEKAGFAYDEPSKDYPTAYRFTLSLKK